MESSKPPTKAIVGLIAAVLLVIAATGAVIALSGNKTSTSNTTSTTASTTNSSSTGTSSTTSSSSTTYKAGSYSATGSYSSPGGQEAIVISVTLSSDGTITDTSATSKASDGEGQEYQEQFINGYKTLVIGKKISAVSLTRVAGSSLTSIGFNDALDQIKTEAAA